MSTSHSLQSTLETRIVGALVILVLLLAFVALYIYPDHTSSDFAWTIKPNTTAILIGEGYLAGALFFVRVVLGSRWQSVKAGFLPITSFTIVMMAATLLHWDRFHQGTLIFFLWAVVYAITPFLVPFLWWRNRARDPRSPNENDLHYSLAARRVLGGIGLAGIAVALAAFFWPSFYIAITPWKLTELTARIFSGWTMLSFATLLSIAIEGRWSATRLLLQSAMFGQILTLLSLPRIWTDLNLANPMAFVFIGALAGALAVSAMIYVWAERLVRRGNALSTPAGV